MLFGVRFKAHPTLQQKQILSQWMGCARFIWNAKCDEERYYATFARKYYPVGTYAPIDQKTAQFKNAELTPWLSDCPSQILRNSAVNWYQTFKQFLKGECGKPKRKPKTDSGSIHLTRELFQFVQGDDGVTRLFIGTKTNNIGYLSFKAHRRFNEPNSMYIKKERGAYFVSFCYDDKRDDAQLKDDQAHLAYLKEVDADYLNKHVIGIDRGVAIPVQAGAVSYDFTIGQKNNKEQSEQYIKRLQRKLAKQKKSSHRRAKTKHRIATYHAKASNIRRDFCHQTSRALVNSAHSVFVFEDLKTKNMTKRPKAIKDNNGKYIANHASQKAGLNKAILDKSWHLLEIFTKYKAYRAGKAFFKISAQHTSQECADCGHIHPDNRQSQAHFQCVNCGHIDHADKNASFVIKKRAINLIIDTGTVLSARGVLSADTGRGAKSQPVHGMPSAVSSKEASKKKRTAATKEAA